jgi:hypothetical protein
LRRSPRPVSLAKPSVDCLSFGPSDLSFSLEAHPEHPFKSVDDCVRHVVQQLQGSPTKVCFRNYTPDLRNAYINMGVTVLPERPRSQGRKTVVLGCSQGCAPERPANMPLVFPMRPAITQLEQGGSQAVLVCSLRSVPRGYCPSAGANGARAT